MKYNINISPAWIGELGLIDDWGPEIDPKDIPADTASTERHNTTSHHAHTDRSRARKEVSRRTAGHMPTEAEGALTEVPSCCALRYSPLGRPGGLMA